MKKTLSIINRIFAKQRQPERLMERVLAGDEHAQSLMAELALNEHEPMAQYYMGKIYAMVGEPVEAYAWYCLAGHKNRITAAVEAMKQHKLSKEEIFIALQRSAELQEAVFVR